MGGPRYNGAIIRAIGAGVSTGLKLRQAYSQTRTNTTTKTMTNNRNVGGNFSSRQRKRTGRRKRPTLYSLKREIQGTGNHMIYRWQNTSATYVGPGALAIDWSYDNTTNTNIERMPIHFMSLSQVPSTIADINTTKGCVANGMNYLVYNTTSGAYQHRVLTVQNSDGLQVAAGTWQADTDPGTLGNMYRMRHNWSDIKLNLYGTYTVPIHYEVFLCTMPEQLDPYQFASASDMAEGSEVANMYKDMSRYLLYSSVGQNGRVDWRRDVKIIKSCKVTIQPLTYSDQLAEQQNTVGSTSAHIHELRWFVRHDRDRNYRWSENTVDTVEDRTFNTPGWDVNTVSRNMTDCEWGKKLFMFITASCPTKFQGLDAVCPVFGAPDRTLGGGSYDICVRNSFTAWQV